MEGELLGGRYRVERRVGEGGMGVVYEALDETLANRVAIKVLSRPEDATGEAVARLMREARAAAALGHPNIVRVTDLGHAGAGAFLVMELLSGRDLDEELRSVGPLGVDRAVRVHLQLLDALGVAHAAGVLHRDVKPSNIFLTRLADGGELVKLLDFGLAYLMEETASARLTRSGMALGTPAYMSPERLCGNPVDPRSDLYAVGVSLFESLTGELPFDADHPMTLRGRVLLAEAPNLRDTRPEVSEALAEVVTRALQKRPADRFASASEMAQSLRAAIGVPAREPTQAPATAAPEAQTVLGHVAPGPSPPASERGSKLGTMPTLAAMPIPPDPSGVDAPGVPVTRASISDAPPAPGTPAASANDVRPSGPVASPNRAPRPARRGWLVGMFWGAGVGGVVACGAIVALLVGRGPQRASSAPPEPATAPSTDAGAALPMGMAVSDVGADTILEPDAGAPEPPAPVAAPPAPPVEPARTAGLGAAGPRRRGRGRTGRPRPEPAAEERARPEPAPPEPLERVDPNAPLTPPGW